MLIETQRARVRADNAINDNARDDDTKNESIGNE
jgi:hypothetical protein